MYGVLMLIPFAVGYGILISPYMMKTDNYITVILLLIPLLLAYFLFCKAGEKIFSFTEKKYSAHLKTTNNAYQLAVVTEFVVFFAVLLLAVGVPFLIVRFTSGNPPHGKINGWD